MFIFLLIFMAVLLFLGIFLSASETALTAASKTRLHRLEKKGNARAKRVLELQSHIGQLISTILLATTWTITAVTSLASSMLTQLFGATGAVYSAILMGAFIAVFIEVMPKIYVFSNPESSAMRLSGFLHILHLILWPITSIIDKTARGCLWILKARINHPSSLNSALEDLRGAIDLYENQGSPGAYEKAMLRSILDLAYVSVSDAMVPRTHIESVCADEPLEAMLPKLLSINHTRIPLWRGVQENIVGILHKEAIWSMLYRTSKEERATMNVFPFVMEPWFIPETTTLFTQLQLFREKQSHMALVVDEYGALVGLITLEDILEEIVGDIFDEREGQAPGIKHEGTTYLIHGKTNLRDLNRLLNLDLSTEEAATLGGLILHECRRLPAPGELFYIHPLILKVLRVHRHSIWLVRAYPLQANESVYSAQALWKEDFKTRLSPTLRPKGSMLISSFE